MVPDPETSEVVQKIFEYAVNGMNSADIARELSRQQIPTPGEHKARKGIKTHDVSRTHGMWCNSTVLRILADERYMGTYVIGKREVTEIGGHKMRSKAESDWIKIPDHHIPRQCLYSAFQDSKQEKTRLSPAWKGYLRML